MVGVGVGGADGIFCGGIGGGGVGAGGGIGVSIEIEGGGVTLCKIGASWIGVEGNGGLGADVGSLDSVGDDVGLTTGGVGVADGNGLDVLVRGVCAGGMISGFGSMRFVE